MTRRATPEFNRNRKIVLEGNPMCHWCKRKPATDADHLTPYDAGGSDDTSNLVPACKSCNSRRGAQYINNKRAYQQQRRAEALGLTQPTMKPVRTGITQVETRSCKTCNAYFLPDWRNVERGGGNYCSHQCFSIDSRFPRWTVTIEWDCVVCCKHSTQTLTIKSKTEPTYDTTKMTCSTECNNVYTAIQTRERYRATHPECKQRDSKYPDLQPNNQTIVIEPVNKQHTEIFLEENFLEPDRKSTRLNSSPSSHIALSRMPSSA